MFQLLGLESCSRNKRACHSTRNTELEQFDIVRIFMHLSLQSLILGGKLFLAKRDNQIEIYITFSTTDMIHLGLLCVCVTLAR